MRHLFNGVSYLMPKILCFGGHIDETATVLTYCEQYGAINESVNGVVFAHTHAQAGMVHGAR